MMGPKLIWNCATAYGFTGMARRGKEGFFQRKDTQFPNKTIRDSKFLRNSFLIL